MRLYTLAMIVYVHKPRFVELTLFMQYGVV